MTDTGMRMTFGLDPDTKRRRLATAETYGNLADRMRRKVAKRTRVVVEGVIERCVQGV